MKRRPFLQIALGATALIFSGVSSAIGVFTAPKTKARIKLPPIPKWNQATDDIDAADFFSRSQDCERALLPRRLVFPRAGQVWEAIRDCEVSARSLLPSGSVPIFLRIPLCQGARVRILTLDHSKPLVISFQAIRPQASHYALWLRTARTVPGQGNEDYFNDLFKLVQDVAA